MKLIAVIALSAATLAFLWFQNTEETPSSSPQQQSANVFLQAGQEAIPVSPSPTAIATTTPPATPTLSPTPLPTATQLVPQSTVTQTPSATASATPTQTPTPTPILTPTATPQSTLSILSLTNPVAQKQDAIITIKTEPGATCTIEVTWPSGSTSTSKDLASKTADANGEIVWSWGVNWNTKPGTATIKLACTVNSQTYSGQTTMQIIASQ